MSLRPMVSICLITYNQEKYIDECIKGALAQKAEFPIEIVVGDDCSKDSTSKKLEAYAIQHPDVIKYNKRDANLGMHKNWVKTIKECTGKYIALLEGDDFWSDPEKLSKQVKLMEENPDAALCFTNAWIENETDLIADDVYVMHRLSHKTEFTLEEFLQSNPIPTCTTLYRNGLFDEFPLQFYESPYADWIVHLLNARHGRILYLSDITSNYRYHSAGVFGKSSEIDRINRMMKCYQLISEIFADDDWALGELKKHLASTHLALEKEYRVQKMYFRYLSKLIDNRLKGYA